MTVKDYFQVKFADSYFELKVLTKHREKICGLCGNFNGDSSDDWIIGNSPYCMSKYPDAVRGAIVRLKKS